MGVVMNIKIYLSGSIKKGNNDMNKKSYWSDKDIDILKKNLSSKYNVIILNPAEREDDLSDFESVMGRDYFQVYISDIVLVDARDKKGIGVGSEMTFAKENSIPVISIAPINSQYNRTNFEYLGQKMEQWIHPFIWGLSDFIVESVEEAADLISNNFPFDEGVIKCREYLYKTMQHYIDTQLINDGKMYNLVINDMKIKDCIKLV